ncbi:glycosyltransferase [Thalassotalea euphylliae]|uniref:glycosyltransferase n=1 Tax=Thalassotalea euphylliae TaxID=1655234 RepID=UPI00363C18CF
MISVLFATHNGSLTLNTMLSAFQNLKVPATGWQVIIVDNASTDNTKSVVDSFKDKLPLEYIHEPRQGKNQALNTGLAHVKGDIVLLTDDDVIPHPNWLVETERAANENPEFDIFGGKIAPCWPENTPDWVKNLVPKGITYAVTGDDWPEGKISPTMVWGPNMVVRRKVFDGGIIFNTDIGPNGTNYAMGSETEFNIRAHDTGGHRCWFNPKSSVQHIIRDNQVTWNWILGRARRFGRGEYCQQSEEYKDHRQIFQVPVWMHKMYVQNLLGYLLASVNGDFERKFKSAWEIQKYKGYCTEAQKKEAKH